MHTNMTMPCQLGLRAHMLHLALSEDIPITWHSLQKSMIPSMKAQRITWRHPHCNGKMMTTTQSLKITLNVYQRIQVSLEELSTKNLVSMLNAAHATQKATTATPPRSRKLHGAEGWRVKRREIRLETNGGNLRLHEQLWEFFRTMPPCIVPNPSLESIGN